LAIFDFLAVMSPFLATHGRHEKNNCGGSGDGGDRTTELHDDDGTAGGWSACLSLVFLSLAGRTCSCPRYEEASKGSKEGFSKSNGSYVRVRCEVPVFWNCVPQPTSLLFLPLDKTSTQNIPESNRSIRQSADRIPTFVAPTTFTVDLSL
jgi:hypothetical protein